MTSLSSILDAPTNIFIVIFISPILPCSYVEAGILCDIHPWVLILQYKSHSLIVKLLDKCKNVELISCAM